MTAQKIARFLVLSLFVVLLAFGGQRPAAAVAPEAMFAGPSCDLAATGLAKAEFQNLSARRRLDPSAVTMDALRAASDVYIALAEACFDELYGPASEVIDDGGVLFGVEGASSFNLSTRKWGAYGAGPFDGVDQNGPRIPGGVVTYSFMASGLGLPGDASAPAGSLTTAVSSLATYQACFDAEIQGAFAAWSAVANIQFAAAADSGLPFNASGAGADIRIAAHTFDGASGVLAHAFFPPPNGTTAAGDLHFDLAENWTCTPGGGAIDIGIVAIHEIGHSIGLNHENRFDAPTGPRVAIMNPFYNPAISLLGDDINGAENLYGSAVGNSPDAIIDFGLGYGAYILNYGVGFTLLHSASPEQIVTADLDGNGIDDIVVDFGPGVGVWRRMNNTTWILTHSVSPTHMETGDLDNSGREDVVMNFAGAGLWVLMNNNNATFVGLHSLNSPVFAIGNIDNLQGDDVVLTFPGLGVWAWMNNTTWVGVHTTDAAQIIIADFDETPATGNEADDLVLGFTGFGIYMYPGGASLGAAVGLSAVPMRMAAGDMNRDGRDELVADFGPGNGLWIYNHTVGWSALHPLSSQELRLGDLDGNGQYELLVDFGASYGLYAYVNNTSWVLIHGLSPEGLAIGDLN